MNYFSFLSSCDLDCEEEKRVTIPRPKVEFTGNENMCNNFQIVFTHTILFY